MDTVTRAGEHCDRIIAQDARDDALRLTKFYLEGFRAQEQYVKNLAEDINDRYESSVTPQYGEHIGHSSVPKMELGAKLAANSFHQQQKANYTTAKHLAERIEIAIGELSKTERIILQDRYINPERETWQHIMEKLGYEERNVYYLHRRGLRSVAVHLFGIAEVLKAEQQKINKRNR